MATTLQEPVRSGGAGRGCALVLALCLSLVAAVLLVTWSAGGLSGWTATLGAGTALLALGCWVRTANIAGAVRLVGGGVALIVASWLLRAVSVEGTEQTRLTLLPDDAGPRLLSKLYPEPDGTVLAARLLGMRGGLRDVESQSFPQILQDAYARTDPPAGGVPTPAIGTYLGLQSPSHFDTIIIAPPKRQAAPDAALVFLHGYAGNFYVYCWEIAQAAAAANLVTLCPSLDASGAWWTPEGDQTFAATVEYLHRSGTNRIYLAGLSNGGAGASVLALAHAKELSGVVLISGTRADRPAPVPTLVIQGSSDEMMPAAAARAYAAHAPHAQYRELVGGHLIFLSQYQRVRPLIADFLLGLEQRAPSSPAFAPKAKN